jgi:hypothetical protein
MSGSTQTNRQPLSHPRSKENGDEPSTMGAPSAGAGACGIRHDVDQNIEMIAVELAKPCKANARTHSRNQIQQIADCISSFGFCNPILIDDGNQIIAGHGRLAAAKLLGLKTVPALRLSHLSDAEKRAYTLADNRLAELAGWDRDILAVELKGLLDLDFDIKLTGFDIGEVDLILNDSDQNRGSLSSGEISQPKFAPAISRTGDLWLLGPHQLRCGDCGNDGHSYAAVDAAIGQWQSLTAQSAVLADTGQTFAEVKKERASTAALDTRRSQAGAAKREAA